MYALVVHSFLHESSNSGLVRRPSKEPIRTMCVKDYARKVVTHKLRTRTLQGFVYGLLLEENILHLHTLLVAVVMIVVVVVVVVLVVVVVVVLVVVVVVVVVVVLALVLVLVVVTLG
jgi:hypothetical protein